MNNTYKIYTISQALHLKLLKKGTKIEFIDSYQKIKEKIIKISTNKIQFEEWEFLVPDGPDHRIIILNNTKYSPILCNDVEFKK